MFDGILGRGFAPKGKPLIKLTKNRIDVLRRKRTATIKFLKGDFADLISNGRDVNAYTRAGGLLDELRHLWNLDFVESTCDFVYKQLSTMQKMEECPEDCREAVSSLMFAASGFSELPELRELRQMFHEKYGDSLSVFVNQELVENMTSKPFSLEKKVKLMEDVASEFAIRWDSKGFEKRISRQNGSSVKETPKSTYDKHMPLPPERKKDVALERRDPSFRPDNYQNGHREHQHGLTSKDKSDDGRHASRSDSKDEKAERKEFQLHPKHKSSRGRPQPIFNEGDTIVMKIKRENLVQGIGHQNGEAAAAPKKTEVAEKHKRSSTKTEDKLVIGFKQESFFKGHKRENDEDHAPQKVEDHLSMPPKPRSKRTVRKDLESRENTVPVGEGTEKHSSDVNVNGRGDGYDPARKFEERETERMMKAPVHKSLPPPPYVKPSGKAKIENPEASANPKARFDGEKGNCPGIDKKVSEAGQHQVNDIDDQSMKRRSSRRKHSIQSGDGEDTRSSRRREHSRKGLQVLIDEDENDSEEKMMDKLLMHYSKKPSSYEKMKGESKSRRSHHGKGEGEEIHHPARSLSLPSEQFAGPSEPAKTFARASSFQPERSEAKHVHPKLPDYEDLAARFAELKGR
ncbi:Regulator of Vps4 activity in the MVB pathway protein [Hirschfeldia incana]|nr:Regulator of Vps4 activity in the MVB pathway protein [Hirschfeldia incana]